MVEWLANLHSAQGITALIGTGGLVAITFIIFAETGLLLGFFLPGDSLLITAGILANPAHPHHLPTLDIFVLNVVLVLAAIIGNQTGYFLGKKTGDRIWTRPDSRFFKRRHLEEAHDFYNRWGGLSIVAARFVPIFRTFVPFVGGVARMPYRQFVLWDIGGGFLWITSLVWLGFFLGKTDLANRLDKVIVVVIFVSILPIVISALGRWKKRSRLAHTPSHPS